MSSGAESLCSGFGVRLRDSRQRAGITYRALAVAAGVSTPLIQLYQRGETNPRIETVERLAVALGVDPRWLAYG